MYCLSKNALQFVLSSSLFNYKTPWSTPTCMVLTLVTIYTTVSSVTLLFQPPASRCLTCGMKDLCKCSHLYNSTCKDVDSSFNSILSVFHLLGMLPPLGCLQYSFAYYSRDIIDFIYCKFNFIISYTILHLNLS